MAALQDRRPVAERAVGSSDRETRPGGRWAQARYIGRRALLVVVAAGAIPGMAGQAHPAAAAWVAHIAGVITSQPGETAPTFFQVLRDNGKTATVQVSASTRVVRRFNGPTTVDALSMGDRVRVTGRFDPGTTELDATRVKDVSIQEADAFARGPVASVNASANTFVFAVTQAPGGSPLSGRVTVQLAPNQAIKLPNGQTETIADLEVGDVVFARGVYDRRSHTLFQVDAVRVVRPAVQRASIQLSGLAINLRHYAVVRVHAAPGVLVHVVLKIRGAIVQQLWGRTGAGGDYTARAEIGYGRWPVPRLVDATAYLYANASVRLTISTYIA